MIDYTETLKLYIRYIRWCAIKNNNSFCNYYQNKCRFYLDEV